MENVNARRSFLKGFGLFGAAAGGFLAVQNPIANTPPPTPIGSPTGSEHGVGPSEDIAHLAPLGKTTLQLSADNTPPPPPPPAPTGGLFVDGFTTVGSSLLYPSILSGGLNETDNKVTLSVGKDNRLWIQVNGTWRRVALEG